MASPVGKSRPCWKVLRVLGNLMDAEKFNHITSEEVLDEFKSAVGNADAGGYSMGGQLAKPNGEDSPADEIDTPLYSIDGLVRRANALQKTLSAKNIVSDE